MGRDEEELWVKKSILSESDCSDRFVWHLHISTPYVTPFLSKEYNLPASP